MRRQVSVLCGTLVAASCLLFWIVPLLRLTEEETQQPQSSHTHSQHQHNSLRRARVTDDGLRRRALRGKPDAVEILLPPSTQVPPDSYSRDTPFLQRTVVSNASLVHHHHVPPAELIQKESSNVVQLHDCAAAVGGVLVGSGDRGMELLLPRSVRHQGSTLRFCSIASTTASQFQFLMRDMPKEFSANKLSSCGYDAASIGVIERPQHAMQFLFSLLGITAMQDSFGFDYRRHLAVIAISSYGRMSSWSDVGNYARYPHMELLQLLSKAAVLVISQRRSMPELQTITPPDNATVWIRSSNSRPTRQDAALPVLCTIPFALFGSLPARMLHYKKYQLDRHAIRPVHFTNFRWRLFEHFELREVTDPWERYAIIVVRRKQKRRLVLNHDALVSVVSSVGQGYRPVVVDWEGMPLKEQLQLALNANVVIGMHGNGHVWDCFMPSGGLMIEFSSDISLRNEVAAGKNRRNVGNLAGLCPIESYSFRCQAVHNAFSRQAPSSHTWKEVDVELSELQLLRVKELLVEHQSMWQRRLDEEKSSTHIRR